MEQLLINNGFVKLPRTILDWEWYDHPDVSRVFFHLILKVNYAPAKWRGFDILVDEHITSINRLSVELALSEFKVRESLNKLKSTGYIEVYPTNKFTKLKLVKSMFEVKDNSFSHKQINHQTSNQPKSNQNQTTTNNNNLEKKEIEERKEFFKNQIFKFSNQYSKIHLDKFYNYWSSENKQTGRQKFEDEKNWDLEQKLNSWIVFDNNIERKKITKNRP